MRVLELFCGIGGAAAALGDRASSVVAVDHDRDALTTYERTFPSHRTVAKNLDTAPLATFDVGADLWWMSPPCEPYGIRGQQRDLDDPRARCFVRVVEALVALKPRYVALENVPWFEGSRAHALLREVLAGYAVTEGVVCPSWLGVPAERKRFYLVAGPSTSGGPRPAAEGVRPFDRPGGDVPMRPLREYVDRDAPADLDVPEDVSRRFGGSFHVVDADDDRAVAACFTSAYGKSPVYVGSYLRQGGRLRRFSPEEIARLHGMPEPRFPDGLSLRRRWALVGNGLSVDAVRVALSSLTS